MFAKEIEMIELAKAAESVLPPAGVHVIVQCRGFRCLAYRTQEGKWKSTYGDRDLDGVVCFLPN